MSQEFPLASPVARFDNGLVFSDDVVSEPGQSFATPAEAEVQARRVASSSNRDSVIRYDGERFHVDTMDEVTDRPTSRFASNELTAARRDVTAFIAGRGQTVGLRATRDGSTAVERIADVFTRAGIPASEARSLATSGITRDQAQAMLTRIISADRGMNDFGPRVLAAELLTAANRNPSGLSAVELAGESQRYAPIRVVRPDGYVARLDNGEPIYRAGELRVQDGRVHAGNYRVGQLLMDSGGVYREVDANLRPGRLLGERPIEQAFPLLSGATDAVALSIYGVAHAVANPREALAGLAAAPGRIVDGVRNLPQTVEQFSQMSDYDRALALGRLGGTVLTTATAAGALRNGIRNTAANVGDLTLNVPPGMLGMPSPVLAVAGRGTRVVPQAIPVTIGAEATQALIGRLSTVAAGTLAAYNTSYMLGPDNAAHEPAVNPTTHGERQAELTRTFGGRRGGDPVPDTAVDPRVASNPATGRLDVAYEGPGAYTRALERARIEAGDLGANRQVLRDPRTGTVIGERSADGARGWRIDNDHANWWDYSQGKKAQGGRFGHSFFPENQAGPYSLSREFATWQTLQ